MSFDYEQNIWGKGDASVDISSPTAFRLRSALKAIISLPADAKVLEVGCGAGQFIRAIKKERPDLNCFGCDISSTTIDLAKTAADGVDYFMNEEKTLPFENNFFDAVLVFDVMEHVLDTDALLLEINRILKPKGDVYAFIPCEGDWLSFWKYLDLFKKFRGLTARYAGHINRYSRTLWKTKIKQNGFALDKIIYSEHFFGQVLGVASFYFMDRSVRKNNVAAMNNEKFFSDLDMAQKANIVFIGFKALVNTLIFVESFIFQHIPSPNAHFIFKKL